MRCREKSLLGRVKIPNPPYPSHFLLKVLKNLMLKLLPCTSQRETRNWIHWIDSKLSLKMIPPQQPNKQAKLLTYATLIS